MIQSRIVGHGRETYVRVYFGGALEIAEVSTGKVEFGILPLSVQATEYKRPRG